MGEITPLERKQLQRLSAFELFQVSVILESGVAATMSEALREVYEYREHREERG